MTISVNDFVRRQVKGSGRTYSSTMSFEEIARHADAQMAKGQFREGYRDGVRVVQADRAKTAHFFCPFVRITEETELEAGVIKRRDNEEAYVQIRAVTGDPVPAGTVDLICYRYDVLRENNEHSTEADWELISIHAVPEGIGELPMGPVTMMRNQLQLPGGTKAYYDSDSWARSVEFWQKFAPLKEN